MRLLTPVEIRQVAGGRSESEGWIVLSPVAPGEPRYVLLPIPAIPNNPLLPPPPPVAPDL